MCACSMHYYLPACCEGIYLGRLEADDWLIGTSGIPLIALLALLAASILGAF